MPDAADPLAVPVLEDLPDISEKNVLVRATLDLPVATGRGSPAALLRTALIVETLQYLAPRCRMVTVCGDLSHPGSAPAGGHVGRVAELVEGVGPNVFLADAEVSVEDPAAVERLVAASEVFVNDSFEWSYLPLPSLMTPPARLPAVAGRSVQHDLTIARHLLSEPNRPFVAVIGGADPIPRLHGLRGLVLRADEVLVGGAISQPLLLAIGRESDVGPPRWTSDDLSSECRSVMGLAARVQHPIELPSDLVVVGSDGSARAIAAHGRVGGDVFDIGPATAKRFAEKVEGAGTLLWSGSLGRAEDPAFAAGTLAVADGMSAGRPQRTVIGGDVLTTVLHRHGRLEAGADIVTSTVALLELLKNGDLPALGALREARDRWSAFTAQR